MDSSGFPEASLVMWPRVALDHRVRLEEPSVARAAGLPTEPARTDTHSGAPEPASRPGAQLKRLIQLFAQFLASSQSSQRPEGPISPQGEWPMPPPQNPVLLPSGMVAGSLGRGQGTKKHQEEPPLGTQTRVPLRKVIFWEVARG